MKKAMKKLSRLALGAVLAAGLGYSVLALSSAKPAFASGPVCEPEDCGLIQEAAQDICLGGAVKLVECPTPGNPDEYIVWCESGREVPGTCADF
jgi:hypothetical protein